jgi:hypothetical protein
MSFGGIFELVPNLDRFLVKSVVITYRVPSSLKHAIMPEHTKPASKSTASWMAARKVPLQEQTSRWRDDHLGKRPVVQKLQARERHR